MTLFMLAFKVLRKGIRSVQALYSSILTRLVFAGNGVQYSSIDVTGCPFVSVGAGGVCRIGKGMRMNNALSSNPIGRHQPCILFVDTGAQLIFGERVGISAAAFVSRVSITVGNDVHIGAGVCVYDTDFHSLDALKRSDHLLDRYNTKSLPVVIGDNVFVGAHSTILKGVVVGENSIIGACSVVTRSVPPNEVWAGNPARMVRRVGR